ncbi:hypothetical protein SY88_19940 [Clostridiales bacterium PH28_bin88]|nr:hypothetical protein SY88_19940 [Clostridiales bacterium PH28_bin88]
MTGREETRHPLWKAAVILTLMALLASGCGEQVRPDSQGGKQGEQVNHSGTSGNQVKQNSGNALEGYGEEADSSDRWEKPQEILLSRAGLPPHFQIGAGERVWDYYDEIISLGQIQPGDNPSFWLVSPFFEPKKFTPSIAGNTPVAGTDPIKLAPLAAGIPSRTVPVAKTDWGYRVGPFPHYGAFREYYYSWVSETGLALHPGDYVSGVVELSRGQSFPLLDVDRRSMAVSADNSRIAFVRDGYLVVRDVAGGEEKKWPLTKAPETDTNVSVEMLSWSPNGRYLLGAWYPYPENFAIDKLWMLDWETGKMYGLLNEKDHPFSKPTWSPDGNQVVVRESFAGYTEGYDVRWIMVNLPSTTIQVVAPRSAEKIDYRFTWDAGQQLQVAAFRPGPGGTRAIGYDPAQGIYQDSLYDDPFVATQLHFVTSGMKTVFQVDLLQALKDTGLVLQDLIHLYIQPIWSPDGKFLYLEGYADGGIVSVANYSFHGSVDLVTRTARFLPAEKEKGHRWLFTISPESRWSGSKVILAASPEVRKLRVMDVKQMRVATLAEGEEYLAARWTDQGLLYVSANKVELIQPDGSARVLVSVPEGEVFVPTVVTSPSGRFLTISRERPDTEGLRWITLEILDLTDF